MWEGNRRTSNQNTERKGRGTELKISHIRPLQKKQSYHGLDGGEGYWITKPQIQALDYRSHWDQEAADHTMNRDDGAFMLSHTWTLSSRDQSDGGGRGRPGGSVRSVRSATPTGRRRPFKMTRDSCQRVTSDDDCRWAIETCQVFKISTTYCCLTKRTKT